MTVALNLADKPCVQVVGDGAVRRGLPGTSGA